jgi:hypothetical protein
MCVSFWGPAGKGIHAGRRWVLLEKHAAWACMGMHGHVQHPSIDSECVLLSCGELAYMKSCQIGIRVFNLSASELHFEGAFVVSELAYVIYDCAMLMQASK